MTRAPRILLVIAATYPVWGFAYEVVTAYWPPLAEAKTPRSPERGVFVRAGWSCSIERSNRDFAFLP